MSKETESPWLECVECGPGDDEQIAKLGKISQEISERIANSQKAHPEKHPKRKPRVSRKSVTKDVLPDDYS